MRRSLLAGLASGLLSAMAAAAPDAAFKDFPAAVAQPSHGPAAVRLADAKSRRYASMLREAARRPPDFAGHHVLASWGCGASCVMAAAIDVRTGAVAWLPFTVCCAEPGTKPLDYRLDSRLIVINGSRNEQGGGRYGYIFDGRRFELIAAHEDAPK